MTRYIPAWVATAALACAGLGCSDEGAAGSPSGDGTSGNAGTSSGSGGSGGGSGGGDTGGTAGATTGTGGGANATGTGGGGNSTATGGAAGTPGTVPVTVPPPETPGEFDLIAPEQAALLTDTNQVDLQWAAVDGAERYEVYLNITRSDYAWMVPGSLLERYSLVGEVTTPSFTTEALPDRWTYKWFVVAIGADGSTSSSAVRQFGVYLPTIETHDDGISIVDGARDMNKNGTIEPYENWRLRPEERVADLMGRMTMEQKALQMFYNAKEVPEAGWQMGPLGVWDINPFQELCAATPLGIPMISAGDTMHGYQTAYPTQLGLGASRNPQIAYEVANMQRIEMLAAAERGVLGPIAEVGTKVLYPRIQEGAGEDANMAAGIARAMVAGLQNGPEINPNSIMAMMKHWPGEGAGGEGGIVFDAVTIKWHMKPWYASVEAGTGSIMPGYAGSDFLDPGGPGAGDSPLIIAYLRNELGYDGIITTDWLPSGAWVDAANAGSDVMGGGTPGAISIAGDFVPNVPEARINEAAARVLLMKFKLGIMEDPYVDRDYFDATVRAPEFLELVTEACRQSVTLLENDGVLPLSNLPAGANVVVTGPRADDANGHTIWTTYARDTTIWEEMQVRAAEAGVNVHQDYANPDVAVVVVGEGGYTHGTEWEKEQLALPPEQQSIVDGYAAAGVPLVMVYFLPRPYDLTWARDNANAVAAIYRPGDGAGRATAQFLFGDFEPHGKLPFQLPRSVETQVGTDSRDNALEDWDLPYDLGATDAERQEIRALIDAGDPVPSTFGDPLYPFGAGFDGWGP